MNLISPRREASPVRSRGGEPGRSSSPPGQEPLELATFAAVRGPALLRLAWLLTADPEGAQDLVQDTFARVVPQWRRIAASGDPEPYVRRAMRSADFHGEWNYTLLPHHDTPGT